MLDSCYGCCHMDFGIYLICHGVPNILGRANSKILDDMGGIRGSQSWSARGGTYICKYACTPVSARPQHSLRPTPRPPPPAASAGLPPSSRTSRPPPPRPPPPLP